MEKHPLGLTVLTTSLAFVLVQLDVSIINVSLATIGARLHLGVLGLQWVVDAYTLGCASLLLSTGALGDRIGHRLMFILGLVLFTGASAACGLAWRAEALIAARVVQGVGAAALVPSSLALLNRACGDDGQRRTWAIGWWTAAGTVGLAAGPLLGGVMVDLLGWRSIFLVNLPIGVFGVWLTRRFVAASAGIATRFDWAGQALAIVALLSLTASVIEASRFGWSSVPIRCGLLVMAAGVAACLIRPTDPPVRDQQAPNRQAGATTGGRRGAGIATLPVKQRREIHASGHATGYPVFRHARGADQHGQ
jgi:DHA2 family methylenomycin A resistance protein-like MFS transporter